jgi:hypothetical protein
VPTNEGQVCSLSLRSAVISADLLEEPVRALLVRAGARTLLTGLFDEDATAGTATSPATDTSVSITAEAAATAGLTPGQRAAVSAKVQQQQQRSPLVPPPELFRYVRQPLRAGVLATLDTARRNAKDTFEALLKGAPATERAALRTLLCREPLAELVKAELAIAKELPVLPLCARGTTLLDAAVAGQQLVVTAHAAAQPKQLFMVLESGCGASSSALLEQFLEQQQWSAVAKLVGNDVYLMTPRFIKVDSDRYCLQLYYTIAATASEIVCMYHNTEHLYLILM